MNNPLNKNQSYTPEERTNWVNQKKEEANCLYKQKKFVDAIKIYMDALTGITMNEKSEEDKRSMKRQYQIPITLNIAMCSLEQGYILKAKQLVHNVFIF